MLFLVLQKRLYPEQANGTYVAVDFIFTDGTTLRDSDAVDQWGVPLHPAYQGAGGHLTINVWTKVRSHIGAKVAGRTIDRILIAYDQSPNTGQFRGYLDDLRIIRSASTPPSTPTPTSTPTATPVPSLTWTTRAGMLTARDSFGIVAASDGKIYAIGGRDSQWYLGTMEAYDPATNTWMPRANMPTARWGMGSQRQVTASFMLLADITAAVH